MTDIVCHSPVDGREIARRRIASDAGIATAIATARTAQRDWAAQPLQVRIDAVLRMLDALLAGDAEAVPELAWQMGRPVRYGGEFRGVAERVRHMAGIAPAALANVVPADRPGFTRYVRRDPLGLVLVIAPWNYPYLTAVNSIAPALIAGNAVLLKHAAQTLLAGERFAAAAAAAGLPDGLFANLVLSHDQTAGILVSSSVDHCVFTGSVAGGRAIERAAAGTFTSLGLELGGKDPAYVREDADLDDAVANLVDGACFNSGQSCCGIERIYVHASLYDGFVERAAAAVSAYVLGDPLDPATTLGPMATARGANHVRTQLAAALAAGARGLVDPGRFPADTGAGPYLAPQLMIDVDHRMELMTVETFGPVVGVMKVADDGEAVRLMNDSPYGLSAAIWTRDAGAAVQIGEQLDTGTVFMNRCDYLDPGLAWTGVKDTGRGASLSAIGYETLTRPKSFHLKLAGT